MEIELIIIILFGLLFSGTGAVIDIEKKMLASEVFIAINEAFEKFREKNDL